MLCDGLEDSDRMQAHQYQYYPGSRHILPKRKEIQKCRKQSRIAAKALKMFKEWHQYQLPHSIFHNLFIY